MAIQAARIMLYLGFLVAFANVVYCRKTNLCLKAITDSCSYSKKINICNSCLKDTRATTPKTNKLDESIELFTPRSQYYYESLNFRPFGDKTILPTTPLYGRNKNAFDTDWIKGNQELQLQENATPKHSEELNSSQSTYAVVPDLFEATNLQHLLENNNAKTNETTSYKKRRKKRIKISKKVRKNRSSKKKKPKKDKKTENRSNKANKREDHSEEADILYKPKYLFKNIHKPERNTDNSASLYIETAQKPVYAKPPPYSHYAVGKSDVRQYRMSNGTYYMQEFQPYYSMFPYIHSGGHDFHMMVPYSSIYPFPFYPHSLPFNLMYPTPFDEHTTPPETTTPFQQPLQTYSPLYTDNPLNYNKHKSKKNPSDEKESSLFYPEPSKSYTKPQKPLKTFSQIYDNSKPPYDIQHTVPPPSVHEYPTFEAAYGHLQQHEQHVSEGPYFSNEGVALHGNEAAPGGHYPSYKHPNSENEISKPRNYFAGRASELEKKSTEIQNIRSYSKKPKQKKKEYNPPFTSIPFTDFTCSGRITGYYADLETECQVFHMCQFGGHKSSFFCPNGTLFNQRILTCDHWQHVKCHSSEDFYVVNEKLYKVKKKRNEKISLNAGKLYAPHLDSFPVQSLPTDIRPTYANPKIGGSFGPFKRALKIHSIYERPRTAAQKKLPIIAELQPHVVDPMKVRPFLP